MPPGEISRATVHDHFCLPADAVFVYEVFSLGLARGYYAHGMHDLVALTGFAREHLHYHNTMQEYRDTKATLLSNGLAPAGIAVVTTRDDCSAIFRDVSDRAVLCGPGSGGAALIDAPSKPAADAPCLYSAGDCYPVAGPARFQPGVVNLEVAWTIAARLGVSTEALAERLGDLPVLPGRCQMVSSDPVVFVDHGKSAPSLDAAITMISREYGKPLLVLSIGGDIDRARDLTPALAKAREVWLTDHTPDTPERERAERMKRISAQLPVAIEKPGRVDAIREAMAHARHLDIPLLVAGRGHFDLALPDRRNRLRTRDAALCRWARRNPIPSEITKGQKIWAK